MDDNDLLARITARVKALDDRGIGLMIALLELLDEPAWQRVRSFLLSNVDENTRGRLESA